MARRTVSGMQRSRRSLVALLVGCVVLVGIASTEHSPDHPPTVHAGHVSTRTR